MATRKPYRITDRHGQTFDLLLSDETQKRDYPNAVPLKVGTPNVKADVPSDDGAPHVVDVPEIPVDSPKTK